MKPNPPVTAVMLTGVSRERIPLAVQAVRSFREQTYKHKKLLIINQSGPHGDLLLTPHLESLEGIREVLVQRPPKVGDLRNMAFDHIHDGLMMQWDDDDYAHPERMAIQVTHWKPHHANVLRRQLTCDLRNDATFPVDAKRWLCGGLPGTILHPRNTAIRYQSLSIWEDKTGEDSVFAVKFRQKGLLDCIDNSPKFYVRFYHGMNSCSESHMVKRYRSELKKLKPEHKAWMEAHVLPRYQAIRQRLRSDQDAAATACSEKHG